MSTDIHIGLINLQTNIEQAKELKLTHINLTPDFQRLYEAWTEKLKTRLIESILLGRAMNPIWTVNNSADACIDVLDGMHRLKTALGYFNNEFALGISLCEFLKTYNKFQKNTSIIIIITCAFVFELII